MEYRGDKTWERREGVPGPPDDPNRVTVRFMMGEDGEPKICSSLNGGPIWLDGYGDALQPSDQGYEWSDVERFLEHLTVFCKQDEGEAKASPHG
jgi:hypothetical protein